MTPMTTMTSTPVNTLKRTQAKSILEKMLSESLRRGFHGTAAVEVFIQDGTIQCIRRRIESTEK